MPGGLEHWRKIFKENFKDICFVVCEMTPSSNFPKKLMKEKSPFLVLVFEIMFVFFSMPRHEGLTSSRKDCIV